MGVSEVLSLGKNEFTVEDVRRVVANCPKQRFALKEGEGEGDSASGKQLLIRANQGHTLQASGDSRLLNIM